ncbi:hypothetical protein IWZ00DRAFT_488751 [Phyllosticta capitalensis]
MTPKSSPPALGAGAAAVQSSPPAGGAATTTTPPATAAAAAAAAAAAPNSSPPASAVAAAPPGAPAPSSPPPLPAASALAPLLLGPGPHPLTLANLLNAGLLQGPGEDLRERVLRWLGGVRPGDAPWMWENGWPGEEFLWVPPEQEQLFRGNLFSLPLRLLKCPINTTAFPPHFRAEIDQQPDEKHTNTPEPRRKPPVILLLLLCLVSGSSYKPATITITIHPERLTGRQPDPPSGLLVNGHQNNDFGDDYEEEDCKTGASTPLARCRPAVFLVRRLNHQQKTGHWKGAEAGGGAGAGAGREFPRAPYAAAAHVLDGAVTRCSEYRIC